MICQQILPAVPHLLRFQRRQIVFQIGEGIRIVLLIHPVPEGNLIHPVNAHLVLLSIGIMECAHQILIKEQVFDLLHSFLTSGRLWLCQDIIFRLIDTAHGLHGLFIGRTMDLLHLCLLSFCIEGRLSHHLRAELKECLLYRTGGGFRHIEAPGRRILDQSFGSKVDEYAQIFLRFLRMTVPIVLDGLQGFLTAFHQCYGETALPLCIRLLRQQIIDQEVTVETQECGGSPPERGCCHLLIHPFFLHDGTEHDGCDRIFIQVLRRILDPKLIVFLMKLYYGRHIRL